MTAGRADLTIEKGSTFVRPIFYEEGDPPVGVDLTGASARVVIRSRLRRALLATLSSEGDTSDSGTITFGDGGRMDLLMSAEETALLPTTIGTYVLEVTRGGVTTRLLEGDVYITRSGDE